MSDYLNRVMEQIEDDLRHEDDEVRRMELRDIRRAVHALKARWEQARQDPNKVMMRRVRHALRHSDQCEVGDVTVTRRDAVIRVNLRLLVPLDLWEERPA